MKAQDYLARGDLESALRIARRRQDWSLVDRVIKAFQQPSPIPDISYGHIYGHAPDNIREMCMYVKERTGEEIKDEGIVYCPENNLPIPLDDGNIFIYNDRFFIFKTEKGRYMLASLDPFLDSLKEWLYVQDLEIPFDRLRDAKEALHRFVSSINFDLYPLDLMEYTENPFRECPIGDVTSIHISPSIEVPGYEYLYYFPNSYSFRLDHGDDWQLIWSGSRREYEYYQEAEDPILSLDSSSPPRTPAEVYICLFKEEWYDRYFRVKPFEIPPRYFELEKKP